MSKKIPFIDLFSGAGGLSAGFEQAGFQAVFANDNDPAACSTYSLNHRHAHVFADDIENLTAKKVLDLTGQSTIPLLIGGPNCQGVSLRGKRDPNDPKNKMFFHYKRLIEELKPDWFVMENVPGLLHRHNRELISSIFEAFDSIGYRCGGEVLLAADYGVPQLRYRFILIGNRHGEQVYFPDTTHRCPIRLEEELGLFPNDEGDHSKTPDAFWRTVRDGIGDLPEIPNGGGSEVMPYGKVAPDDLTEYQLMCRRGSEYLYNHVCHATGEHNIHLIKHIPPGKNWKSIPEELRPARFKRVALKDHTTTYGRLRWDMPARTITTYFNNISAGAFTHPDQHRGISVREGARLQSFPDWFRFSGTLARQYRQVGNAVPPLMARHIAAMLSQIMKSGSRKRLKVHTAAVEYDRRMAALRIHRPLQGMRFNLDKYLVRS
ncbi:MAG: DNA cytosine methyltransferase [Acidobacteriota bacterium]|nr:DNA cytosine methyltransferase [Acidobacteriota bacterium]